mgnify:CR=1 FL=1
MSTIMNTTYKIAIGADHAGVDLKETVAELLKAWGHEVTDMGTMTKNSCDYSDYANAVGALFDVPVNQFAQAGVIDPAIRKKRGYQGNNTAADCLHVGIFQHISATGVAA